jgi:excisionase family DNA binding protein
MNKLNSNWELATVNPAYDIFEPLIEVPQMAELLHLHPKTVQAMCRRGVLRAVKCGRRWLSRVSDLDSYVRDQLSSVNQSRREENQ